MHAGQLLLMVWLLSFKKTNSITHPTTHRCGAVAAGFPFQEVCMSFAQYTCSLTLSRPWVRSTATELVPRFRGSVRPRELNGESVSVCALGMSIRAARDTRRERIWGNGNNSANNSSSEGFRLPCAVCEGYRPAALCASSTFFPKRTGKFLPGKVTPRRCLRVCVL